MDKEIISAIKKFVESFEQVFHNDWDYTKEQLGIYDESSEQKQNAEDAGLEAIYIISPDGTFLNPNVEDEAEDWGHRAKLLADYRQLKKLLSTSEN